MRGKNYLESKNKSPLMKSKSICAYQLTEKLPTKLKGEEAGTVVNLWKNFFFHFNI